MEKGTLHWSAKDTTLENYECFIRHQARFVSRRKGAVVEGVMQGENFAAATLLVKHSEEYRVENHDQKKSNYLKSITE